jgi:hypothetical protein
MYVPALTSSDDVPLTIVPRVTKSRLEALGPLIVQICDITGTPEIFLLVFYTMVRFYILPVMGFKTSSAESSLLLTRAFSFAP